MPSVLHDLRFALRTLRRRPYFTAVAVGALGIGIGAAAAIYSVVDGVLIRQLPYREPGRLVNIWITTPNLREHPTLSYMWANGLLSYPRYHMVRENSTLFEDVAIYGEEKMLLAVGHDTQQIRVGTAGGNLFRILGVEPHMGRLFQPGDDGHSGRRIAVLGYDVWQSLFGADPSVVGRTVVLDNQSYEIVGILPGQFEFPSLFVSTLTGTEHLGSRGLWVPVGHRGTDLGPGDSNYEMIGRLASGVTEAQARAEAEALLGVVPPSSVRVTSRTAEETGEHAGTLLLLLGTSAVLLLIACSNVATLQMGEILNREGELAIRAGLGAAPSRIASQLLTESLVLGLLGSVLGIVIAKTIPPLLLAYGPAFPHPGSIQVNGRVILVGALAGATGALLFGLGPALVQSRRSPALLMGEGYRTTRSRTSGGQQVMLTCQIGLTAVLLVTASLLAQSLNRLLAVRPGFDGENVVAARVSLPAWRYGDPEVVNGFYRQVQEAIEKTPRVEGASASRGLPFAHLGQAINSFTRVTPSGDVGNWQARRSNILPGYFQTLRIPLLTGRAFTWDDGADAPRVAIISESLARRSWPDGYVLGSTLVFRRREYTVIGIVGDVRPTGLSGDIEPMFYLPALQYMEGDMYVLARATTRPQQLLSELRSLIRSVDPGVAIVQETSLSSLISQSTRQEQFRALLVLVFAVSAAVLSAVGIGGVTARMVEHRTRELGIRLAVGGSAGRLVRMILWRSLAPGLIGLTLGLLTALGMTRFLSHFLFEIEPWDPLSYVSVAAFLAATCIAAAYMPARRITRMDPVQVLVE